MDINVNFHLSQKFLSRQPGYNIFVVFDFQCKYVRSLLRDIQRIAKKHPSIYLVERDQMWSQLIEKNTSKLNGPIYLLYYKHHSLRIYGYRNFSVLGSILDRIQNICDID